MRNSLHGSALTSAARPLPMRSLSDSAPASARSRSSTSISHSDHPTAPMPNHSRGTSSSAHDPTGGCPSPCSSGNRVGSTSSRRPSTQTPRASYSKPHKPDTARIAAILNSSLARLGVVASTESRHVVFRQANSALRPAKRVTILQHLSSFSSRPITAFDGAEVVLIKASTRRAKSFVRLGSRGDHPARSPDRVMLVCGADPTMRSCPLMLCRSTFRCRRPQWPGCSDHFDGAMPA